jgi:hypothetical protein
MSMNRDIVLAGEYQPNADEEDGPLVGIETISKVWPMKPPSGYLNIFIRLPASQY